MKPSDLQAPVREAGGDNEVPRDSKGRPRIVLRCDKCPDTPGKVPSPKTGKPIKCSKCSGTGEIERSYTRVTTYIDVLDDKSNLQKWGERLTLVGAALDRSLLDNVESIFEEYELAQARGDAEAVKKYKDELNRRAQVAKLKAGAEKKADKGTHLHGLSELVDMGLPLPTGIEFGDVIDMDAYRRRTEGFNIVHMEKLVVNDEIKVGGTPDRVSEWIGDHPLVAPNGYVFEPGSGELLITDLKTGTTEYGALKMAMQLAIYSRSDLYNGTIERTPLGNINQDWGIIMNVPAGSGECEMYWADLRLGWRAVEVASQVRELRRAGKGALSSLSVGAMV